MNALARHFGGGGHKKASGATLDGSLVDVRARVVAEALSRFPARSAEGASEVVAR